MDDLTIRSARPSDAAEVYEIYAPIVRDTTSSFELEPPSIAELEVRIEETLADHEWLIAASGGTVHGYAYATKHRSRAAYRWTSS